MASRSRCVVDTNVLISAALSPQGTPSHATAWIIVLASEDTFAELTSRLIRPKFQKYLSTQQIAGYVQRVRAAATFTDVTIEVAVCNDPDDDAFVALALAAEANYLITGDLSRLSRTPGLDYAARSVTCCS